MSLEKKKILLIVGGGISAYKSLDLIRLLQRKGSSVKVVLTKSGKKFVTSLSISSLSKSRVFEEMFDEKNKGKIDHISLSRWADLILVLPATANFMSKLSKGSADDLASTIILASNKEIFLTPAMNVRMWLHKATQKNLNTLIDYGYKFIGPENGEMACGEYGKGKMSSPRQILSFLEKFFKKKDLLKKKKISAIVTTGPTKEYIDPVRFISNESSGKQGYEIALELSRLGIKTTLISGPTNLKISNDINLIQVETTEEMFKSTQNNLPVDVAIFSAAVADFKIKEKEKEKIKKKDFINLNLEKNIDILNYVSSHNSLRPKLVIGFSAETSNIEENSRKKLMEKNCDWIIANDISNKSIGFDSDFNEVTILYKDKKINDEKLNMKKKSEIADEIIDRVVIQLN